MRTKKTIDFPSSVEAAKFKMEQMDYNQKDLTAIVGLKSRASEMLNRKRNVNFL